MAIPLPGNDGLSGRNHVTPAPRPTGGAPRTVIKSLFDLRAMALALVLAVAAALPRMTTGVERRDYYFFDITLTATAPGYTQLFWDLGRGFNESDSSRQPLRIEPAPVVYRYMMPMGDIKALRLDPTDGVGSFHFSHAQIVDTRGRVVHTFSPADFKARQEIARLEPAGDEVYVETTPDSRDSILELKSPAPIQLAGTPRIWLALGLPVALPVFLLGLLLGCPLVARPLLRLAARLGGWLQARPRTSIALVGAVVVAIQCHPVLFQGRSFASPENGAFMLYGHQPTLPGGKEHPYTNMMRSDTGALLFQHLYYPMVQRAALLDGELPLWNRYSLGGEPLLGQGQSMFGDPFNFITIAADGAAWAWDIRFVLAHWLLAAGLGLTAWHLTRHFGSALLVTVGGGFVAFFTYRLLHPANFSVCYSPWILWAWTGLLQAKSPRGEAGWLGALVAANWVVMTSGTMKEAYMLMACLNLAGVVLLALSPPAPGRRLRQLLLATAAGGAFILLTAPGWMSFLVSWRHSYTGYDVPVAVPLPLRDFIGFFDDIFYRQITDDETVLAPALNFLFLTGVLWWLVAPRLWRSDRAGRALFLAALPPFALAFGLIPSAVIVKIPFVGNIVHVGNTFSSVLLILLALLAGCGFRDAIESIRKPGWWRQVGLLTMFGAVLAAAFFLGLPGRAFSPFFTGYVPALTLAGLSLLVGARWALQSTLRPGALLVGLGLGLPMLLWRHSQYGETFFNHYAFVPGWRFDLHAASPAVAAINHAQTEPGRVLGWDANLYPSYNTAVHWEGLYGVDAVRSRYYQELAEAFDLKRVWIWDWSTAEAEAPHTLAAYNLLNVTHSIATHTPAPRTIAGLQLVGQYDLDVYASPGAWPRAFFTTELGTYATVDDFARLVRTGDGRPFAAVQANEIAPAVATATPGGRVIRAATNYQLTANNTSFVINAPQPGVAVLTEAYYAEDFQVTLNGQPAPYFRVNHAFKGVVIPAAGRYEIKFAYWPQYFTTALFLSAAGAAGLAVGCFFLVRSRAAGQSQAA